MAAQPGGDFLLQYGPQDDEAQAGGNFTLIPPPTSTAHQLAVGSRHPWQKHAPADIPGRAPYLRGRRAERATRAPWGIYTKSRGGARVRWVTAAATDSTSRHPWNLYQATRVHARLRWGTSKRAQPGSRHPWGEHRRTWRPSISPWGTSRHVRQETRHPWGLFRATNWGARIRWNAPVKLTIGSRHPFGTYNWTSVGTSTPTPPGGPTTDPNGTILIPVKRTYIVTPDVHLVLSDTGQEIPCLGMTASIDYRSWLWSVNAQIPMDDAEQFQGETPVEITATWNGFPVRAIIENMSSSRAFGSRKASIRGTSPAAVLGGRYAAKSTRTNTEQRTAQQLAVDALEFTGHTVVWDAIDWLVDAGAWSHFGTPAEAVQQIANTIRALVQVDPIADEVRLSPYYPVAPWLWPLATPDAIVPLDVVVTESVEWRTRPDYNRAYISGQAAGVLGQVTREGTAGDKPAPLRTHPLVTHADAARQAGIAVLGDTGRQAWVTLSMPLSEEIALLQVGWLVEMQDDEVAQWRGLVRSVEISAAINNGAVSVRQRITIERHTEPA